MNRRWIVIGMVWALMLNLLAEEPAGTLPKIESEGIREASGLAVSQKGDDLLWVINDSGGSTELHLIGMKGEDRGKAKIEGVANLDWEDLASFTLEGIGYLLIADTGDNQAKHDTSTLLIIREPELPEAGKKLAGSARMERTIEFRFEGGPVDCESVTVDAEAGKIILLSKRTQPPQVFELSLKPSETGIQTAKRIGTARVESPAGAGLAFGNQPTSLDISPDCSKAAVVTYYGAFVFKRAKGESWSDAFAKKPTSLGPHGLPQAESIAFSKDGNKLHVVSEGRHSLIRSFSLTEEK